MSLLFEKKKWNFLRKLPRRSRPFREETSLTHAVVVSMSLLPIHPRVSAVFCAQKALQSACLGKAGLAWSLSMQKDSNRRYHYLSYLPKKALAINLDAFWHSGLAIPGEVIQLHQFFDNCIALPAGNTLWHTGMQMALHQQPL